MTRSATEHRHGRYWTTLWLSGFVVAGWLWDLALGGGIGHSIAWLIALILIAGVSGSAARARTREQPQQTADAGAPTTMTDVIRPATEAELPVVIEVEEAADRLFEIAGYGSTPGPASVDELRSALLLLVIGDPVAGYVRVETVDGAAHIESLSVRPRSMRQGIGSRLVEAACDWAAEEGFETVTLTTFADVPWNAPFYRTLQFEEDVTPTAGVQQLRREEIAVGLDRMGRRIVMRRDLTGPDA